MPASTHHARNGMVCTVDHLASAAGVAALRAGGTAADAAIAANAVLTVTAPHMCGLGGDLFALVHDAPGRPAVLNASGRAGSGADAARLRAEGRTEMPFHDDVRSVTVPGCVAGWQALHERYGLLPLAELLAPAIDYAASGFPASPLLAWVAGLIAGVPGAEDLAEVDRPGRLVRRPGVARMLRAVAAEGAEGFYQGEFGAALIEIGAGEYTEADLAAARGEWVEPVGLRVFGHDVWTVPPNSQGYLVPMALGIAERLGLPDDPADPLWAHLMVEAARLAGHDRGSALYDGADVSALLAPAELDARAAAVRPDRRAAVADLTASGDTTYLCAADGSGRAVSLIQSNASGFGSRLFAPGTGVNLHNRGIGFSLAAGHPAEYAPGRRPPHTLSPVLITHPDGSLYGVAGTMGGDIQPQVVQQVLARLLLHGQDVAAAVAAPRWATSATNGFDTWADPDGAGVRVEEGAPAAWVPGLRDRGHPAETVPQGFAHAHAITRDPDGTLSGAADHRALIAAAAGY
ncbi:gamma-glutamyltransferase family protein [Allonocardiopsis opalescens]|uniref:Gamma-glutamyltranspeptidase/glutathione hydrolase n=1 Tax=Allonocardiopsis opalescens TaxID=1144618 RepID=A0A2T0PUC5_9ACTN|nr:gamma-glutamyltransferase [Allonocardiopsis opalescens]PRX92490.1 gamma-glutamyltranspeptidase/glutathione hydrolase [Allonocardiopsis opalescens]